MIKSISIKNVATFIDEVQLNDLKKINFIYGSNGSGKTTISNFIHSPEEDKFQDCSLQWDGGVEVEALVYNKEFRDRNFDKDDIPGVFTLGEATKEEIAEINKRELELDDIKKDGKAKRIGKESTEKTRDSEINSFREIAWARYYKKHETVFKEAFTGHQGSKQKFYEKLLKEFVSNTAEMKPIDELEKKATTIFGKPPVEVIKFSLFEFSRINEIEQHSICNS